MTEGRRRIAEQQRAAAVKHPEVAQRADGKPCAECCRYIGHHDECSASTSTARTMGEGSPLTAPIAEASAEMQRTADRLSPMERAAEQHDAVNRLLDSVRTARTNREGMVRVSVDDVWNALLAAGVPRNAGEQGDHFYTDQPTECAKCGTRTKTDEDDHNVERCPSCGYVMLMHTNDEDDDA